MTAAHHAWGDRSGRGSPTGAPATNGVTADHKVVTGDQDRRPARSILVTGARGGQGTTTVAAALALSAALSGSAVLVAPPCQAAAAVLGVPSPERGESIDVTDRLSLAAPPAIVHGDTIVVDGGLHAGSSQWLSDDEGESYVVVRGPCYLALTTLLFTAPRRPDGVILVAEEGRSLTARDVFDVTGVPVVATVEASPRVARTIDAGLLPTRITRLRELAQLRALTLDPIRTTTPLRRRSDAW